MANPGGQATPFLEMAAIQTDMAEERSVLHAVPPFRLDFTVWALRRRKSNAIDRWAKGRYTRIISLAGDPAKVAITQQGTMDKPKLFAVLQGKKTVIDRIQKDARPLIQRMFGLDIDLRPFYALANGNDILKPLCRQFLGVKPPRFPSVFEALVNAIACQQVTLDLGILLLNRLSESFGLQFDEGGTALHAFPRPEDVADVPEEEVKRLGFSRQKARAIKEMAAAVRSNEIDLASLDRMADDKAVEYLSTIRGIGRWSAEYVLLRGLGRIHVFPGDDVGAQNNLERLFHLGKMPDYKEIKNLTSAWHPYEGMVYFHLLLDKLHARGEI